MKNKLTVLLLLISISLYSQENTQGEIIISRDNLISLLQKFRKEKSNLESVKSDVVLVEQNKKVAQKASANIIPKEDKTIQKKIDSLSSEIALLNRKLDLFLNKAANRDSIYVQKRVVSKLSNTKTDTIYKKVTSVDTLYRSQPELAIRTNATNDEKIDLLNRKYDLMLENQRILLEQNKLATAIPNQTVNKDAAVVETQKKTAVKNSVVAVEDMQPKGIQNENLKTLQTTVPVAAIAPKIIRDTIYIKESVPTNVASSSAEYSKLVATYSKVKKQVFFENNSVALSTSDFVPLMEVIKIIEQNPTIDIYLEGFASQKGNATYNEKISLQRTEAVKQFLISKGIHPKRILSYYHGVDNTAPNEGFARRVDLTFEIRK